MNTRSANLIAKFASNIRLSIIPAFEFTKFFGVLFNPATSIWRTWLGPAVYHPYNYWYGGGALGAPYSLLWYAFYWPIAWNDTLANLTLLSLDTICLGWIWKTRGYRTALLYQTVSILFLAMYPSDMLIFWLAMLAYKWKPFLVIAPAVKLPFGAPVWVWEWVWTSPYSIHSSENILRYTLLGAVWSGALAWQYGRTVKAFIRSRLSRDRQASMQGTIEIEACRPLAWEPIILAPDGRTKHKRLQESRTAPVHYSSH